jgi:hypothetical protein
MYLFRIKRTRKKDKVQNRMINTIENTGPKSFFDWIRKNPKFEISNKEVMYSDNRLAE